MASKKTKTINPFYVLLIPASAAFCITAVAYGYMAFQAVNSGRLGIGEHADHPLYVWLQAYGTAAILIELAVLAVLTIGAIGTDGYWSRASDDGGAGTADAEDQPS
ncbi:MAG: hypothetical protein AAGA92_02405 [Planctomycetota bacterium]